MINVIPSNLEGLTKGEQQIVEKIKKLYTSRDGNNFLYIQPRLRNLEPDFMLIDSEKGAAIL